MVLVPTPATTVARSPTASLTAARISPSSATVVVGRLARRAGDHDAVVAVVDEVASRSAAVPSRSTEPSSWNAVAIAVSTRPNGAAGAEVMGVRLSLRAPVTPAA